MMQPDPRFDILYSPLVGLGGGSSMSGLWESVNTLSHPLQNAPGTL